MKKNYYLLILLSILFTACSSDDEKVSAVKYEFSSYLIDEISIKDYHFDEEGSSFELGWLFDSENGGKVVELGGLFPVGGTYTVTLWDAETEDMLAQAEVSATAGKRVMKKIDAITIEAGKDYVVSYNTYSGRDYYWLEPETSIYPLKLNGITVYGEVEDGNNSENSVFPGTNLNETIVGVPEIGFVEN